MANTTCSVSRLYLAVALVLLASTGLKSQIIDVLDETILLSNGTPTSGNTSDAEDNFGGRAEWIIGNNNGNARGGLLRFDVSSVSDAINDVSQIVSEATLVLNTADAREEIQPTSETIFDVYAVVPENAGWLEGTQQGSRGGWSGEPESASLLYLANPEFEPEDPLAEDLLDEFDDARLWHSASENDGFPTPFEVGIDTGELSIGTVSTDEIDGGGFLEISLDPEAINSLLPQWLADPEENPGLYIFPTEGSGQWFFESNEGFEDEAVDLVLAFASGGSPGDFNNNGELDAADVNSLISQINGAQDVQFDVSGDGVVDAKDLTAWVKDLKNTWIGDANLDGEFNSSDFVAVFTAGLFETDGPAEWSTGDWNGDGVFGSGDFVAAFTDGGFELGPRAGAHNVPEPTTYASLFVGVMMLAISRRLRKVRR